MRLLLFTNLAKRRTADEHAARIRNTAHQVMAEYPAPTVPPPAPAAPPPPLPDEPIVYF